MVWRNVKNNSHLAATWPGLRPPAIVSVFELIFDVPMDPNRIHTTFAKLSVASPGTSYPILAEWPTYSDHAQQV